MTLIGNFIIKNASGIDGCSNQSSCGDTISQLANRITSKVAKLLPYDFVILHLGTNDIDNRAPFVNIIKDLDYKEIAPRYPDNCFCNYP